MNKTTSATGELPPQDHEARASASPFHNNCRGEPNGRRVRGKGGWVTFPFIGGALVGMLVAQFGVLSNLIVYLIQEFNFKSIDAAQISNIINGCTFAAPIVGAIIADSWFGCFPVLIVTTFISLLGVILFTISAAVSSLHPCSNSDSSGCENVSSTVQLTILFAAVALVTIGYAGTRFNIATMGANQFERTGDQSTFFNWFFCLMYIGSIIGSIAVVYTEDNVSWAAGFSTCVAMNAGSLISILLGVKYYRKVKPEGSPFTSMARVVFAAIRKAKIAIESTTVKYCHGAAAGDGEITVEIPSQGLRFFNRAAVEREGDITSDGTIARPWRLCTVRQVEDLKAVVKILPLAASGIFVNAAIATQTSLTVLQALKVDRYIGHHISVPAGSLLAATLITTAIALPLLDRIIYPLVQRLIARIPTPLQRIGVGHVLNAAGMVTSALVERRRLNMIHTHGVNAGGVAPMSVAWLALPMVVAGFGEAFHFPGQTALYYAEFPEGLRTTGTSLISVNIALGTYISTAIIDLIRRVTGWLPPDDINAGRVDRVYWTMSVICFINFCFFLLCARLYRYRSLVNEQDSERVDKDGPD